MSELQRKIMKRLPLRLSTGSEYRSKSVEPKRRGYSPLEWSAYFDSFLDLPVSDADGTFRLYLKNMEPEDDEAKCPLLILLHGAGYSALSWGLFAKSISRLITAKIVAIDLRGHGSTETLRDSDLSSDQLTHDVTHIYQALCKYPKYSEDLENAPVVFIGHSMGGAIATRTSLQDCELIHKNLSGLVVIDVVEGTALDGLSVMHGLLLKRPTLFPSLENAIEWALRSGQTRNSEAARLSMPGMLKKVSEGPPSPTLSSRETDEERTSTSDSDQEKDDDTDEDEGKKRKKRKKKKKGDDEDSEDAEDGEKDAEKDGEKESESPSCQYEWRVNLFDSREYWEGWFTGLSKAFLQSKSPAKLLLLAGIDRLDKELTEGQMQGKFQMHIVPQSSHAIHEDHPNQVARVIATFLVRHKLTDANDGFTPSPASSSRDS